MTLGCKGDLMFCKQYKMKLIAASLSLAASVGAHAALGNLLITNPRDIKFFIRELKKYRVSVLPAVNTLFNALLHHPDFQSIDFSSWKLCLGGGMAVQENVAKQWKALTGQPIVEVYGLTEASPGVCAKIGRAHV